MWKGSAKFHPQTEMNGNPLSIEYKKCCRKFEKLMIETLKRTNNSNYLRKYAHFT